MSNIIFPDETLSKMWDDFDFDKAEEKIFKLQQLLSIAAFKHRDDEVKKLSLQIVSSVDAKMIAVRKVSEKSNSATGIDRVRWITSSEKMNAALSLNPKDYKAKPFKRFIITDEKSNKERRINIPSMFDRAMQVLYMMALEPIEEATGDRKSFAFRKGRSALDLHALLMHALNDYNAPEWVLVCDIKSYYDSISHKWLLDNIPMDKQVLKEFLKAGIIFNNELFPTDVGISLGCNISTILGNMTLDGLQQLFYNLQDKENMDYYDGYVLRFADDILVTARTKDKAELYLNMIEEFAQERGLEISKNKTYITNVSAGFDFLSRHYYKLNKVVHCKPSENAVKRFENELYDLILNHEKRWSQKRLIESLNAKLNGWATYHRVSEAGTVFNHIDVLVSALLLNLMKDMHPKLPVKTIIKKYWYQDSRKRNIFALTTNKNIQVIKLEDVVLVEHKRLNTKQNIFLDSEYFEERLQFQDIQKISGRYKSVWIRQDGKCYYCGKKINIGQPRKIIYKDLTIKNYTINNMAYIHSFCGESENVFINSNSINNNIDVSEIIKSIQDIDVVKAYSKNSKYKKLYEYFATCTKYTFQISFSDIEEIVGFKLCDSLYNYENYWHLKGKGVISNCWLNNGYTVKRIYLKEKKVTFVRIKKQLSKINIPDKLLSSDIPKSAKHEIEQFFDYIIKKYGL